MEIQYLWRLIGGRFRFVATTCLVATVGALLFTYVVPARYQASTTILIRPQRQVEFTPTQTSMLGFPPSVSNPPETISLTYASMMTSTAVTTRVVRTLGLDAPPPAPSGPWYARSYRWARDGARRLIGTTWDFVRYGHVASQDPFSAAVERLGRQLSALPIKGTYLFSLTATWDDPHMAAQIANAAAEAFTLAADEARQTESRATIPYFGAQLDQLRGELAAARDRLAEYRARNQVSSLDEQVSVNLKTLAELEADLEEAVNQNAETKAALTEVESLLAREPEGLHTAGTSVTNPVVESLKQQLARDQVRLAALRQTTTNAHPDVRALTASMEEAQQRIAAETARVTASETSELNPFYKALKQQHLDRSVAAQSLAARVSALRTSIGTYRGLIATLSGHREELARLELDTDVLENQYRLLTNKAEEARLSAAQGLSDLRTLAPAVAPLYPTGPIRFFYAAGGFLIGLLGAIFVLLLSDYMNPRVRTVEEIARLIGVPTLAQVPGVSNSRSVTDLLGDSATQEGVIVRMATRELPRRAAS